MNITEESLLRLCKEIYPNGDSHYVNRTKKSEKWMLGYTNDYPLQHGNGDHCVLPDRLVELALIGLKKTKK